MNLLCCPLFWLASLQPIANDDTPPPPVGTMAPADYRTVALMPLTSMGSSDAALDAVQRVLLAEVQKLLAGRLISPHDLLNQDPTTQAAFASCEGMVACLVEVVGGLGWDAFVVGNVAGIGSDRIIKLKLIDVRTGQEMKRSSEKVYDDEAALIRSMRKAAVELLAPERFVGTLELVALQPGVQILVDGALLGTTPLANSRTDVRVGLHAVEATGEGLVPFTTMVELTYGESKTVTVNLAQSSAFVGGDTPYRHRWWVWGAAGGGVVSTLLGGYFNYLHLDAVDRIESKARAHALTSDNGPDLYHDQQAHWRRAVVFYSVGGILLLGTGVLLSLDFL